MPKLLTVSLTLLAATIALTGCNREVPDTHPDQPVTKRRALFKEFTRTLEPMGLVARERQPYKADKFLEQAQALKKLSTQPWPLFTPDSNYPPTTANAKVWQQPENFKQAQTQFLQAVDDLNAAAAGSDLDRIKTTVNDVQKACKACHDSFRNEKLL